MKRTLLFLFLLFMGSQIRAQEEEDSLTVLRSSAPNIFVDCEECDHDYIKTEITFVNYVRDRKDAQIHILVTTQKTGSGGREYTLTFIGQKEFEGMEDTLTFFSEPSATEDEIRKEIVQTLKIGAMPYIAKTPLKDQISISIIEKAEPSPIKDPWDFWVFRINLYSFLYGQQTTNSIFLRGSLSANQITSNWKIRFSAGTSYNEDNFTIGGEKITSTSKYYWSEGLIVKSLNDHWSIGTSGTGSSSTYSNERLNLFFAPAIEYNFFPYSESTRRELRFLYRSGVNPVQYEDTTIYFKTSEILYNEDLSITLEQQQPWGSVSTTLSGSNYFHDFRKNRLTFSGYLSLRLVKGFSFSLSGSASRIRDQLSLPKGEATEEEILLRLKELETGYEYSGSVGLSYTFGSIYSSVVNPRFGD